MEGPCHRLPGRGPGSGPPNLDTLASPLIGSARLFPPWRALSLTTRLFLYLGIGGALGTWARFGTSVAAYRLLGSSFPWGTLVVNTAASFLIGFAAMFAEAKGVLSPGFRLFFLVGFLGGFSTFSSLTFESYEMLRAGALERPLLNVGANLALGFGALFAGVLLAQTVAAPRGA